MFFRNLRDAIGEPLAYGWVPEWHKTDHGLHAHFAVGRFVRRGVIETAWGHGFIKIKLIGDLPVGSGVREEARVAARYMAKYIGKGFEDRPLDGLHRYEVAQGFQPSATTVTGRTSAEALREAERLMGGPPDRFWDSGDTDGWQGPPAVWASWR